MGALSLSSLLGRGNLGVGSTEGRWPEDRGMGKSPQAKVKGRSRFLLQLPEGLTLLRLHLEVASRSGDHASLWSEPHPGPLCSCNPTELTQEAPCPEWTPSSTGMSLRCIQDSSPHA